MDAIIGFFQAIGDAIVAIFSFVISLFGDLVWLIQMLGGLLGNLPSYFSWLPSELLAILLVILAAAVVFRIMGR